MLLPYLKAETGKNRRQVITFSGLHYGQGCTDGELEESWGLSSARFPCLSQRKGRKTAGTYRHPSGLYARGKLCLVDGTDFLYDGTVVGQVSRGEKQFATINTKIVIFPDKMFYDTATGEFGSLDARYTIHTGDAEFTANTLQVRRRLQYMDQEKAGEVVHDGVSAEEKIVIYMQASVDSATGKLDMGLGRSDTPDRLQPGDYIQYGCDSATEYLVVRRVEARGGEKFRITGKLHKIYLHQYQDFTALFQAGDAITISGCESCTDNNGSHIVRAVTAQTLTFTQDIFSKTGLETGTLLLERKVPELSCVCESDNRIWGAEGETIYASALGDPRNFFVYDGISTDSWTAAVGTDGAFTGCCAYSGAVLFWKENCLHKVLGSYPAQYEIYTYEIPGVQKGSEKSLVVMNGMLLYKGRSGVYAYSGGTPELLTEKFGTRRFFDAVSGADGEQYYISMRTEKGVWELYVFDTVQRIWLREDETHALDFAFLDGKLYYLDADSGKLIMTGQDEREEGAISWSATLCQMDETSHGKKSYSRLYLRADLDAGAWLQVEISPDGAPFRRVFSTHNPREKSLQIPILPVRCDNFRIRLSGKGGCLVKSLIREFSLGSEY